jgi:CTP synthase
VAKHVHPEIRSRPKWPHPLFAGLVEAALTRQRELRFPLDEKKLRRRNAESDADHMDPVEQSTV